MLIPNPKIMAGVRDAAYTCSQCFPQKRGYVRLTIKELSEWKSSVSKTYTCDNNHPIKWGSLECFFRVDADGNTIDPSHPAWTRNRRD